MGIRSGHSTTAYSQIKAMQFSGRRNYVEQYVTDGNTARVIRPQPQKHRLTEEQRERLNRLNETAERSATVSLTLPLALLLTAAMALVFAVGYKYLCLKSSIDLHMDNVKSLETQLENLKTENDALERSIDTSIDLNHVYEVATKELGMVPASRNNIIQYDKSESEYVRQYDDIPSSGQ